MNIKILHMVEGAKEATGVAVIIDVFRAFTVLEKYIDHHHIVDGKPLRVINTLKDEILNNFKYLMELKKGGRNLFFPDIDRIKEIMLEELNKK